MSDEEVITDSADTIERRLQPETVARLITWRDTELGRFEEEDVKQAARRYAI